jgi:hypothetical protein
MGITIHYRGRLNDADRINEFMTGVARACHNLGWTYDRVTEHDPVIKGLIIHPSERCDPLAFLFSKAGFLLSPIQLTSGKANALAPAWVFVKTQFAGPEVHVRVVRLLKWVKERYISNLEVEDEGEYWETENFAMLKRKMEAIATVIDRIVKESSALGSFEFPDARPEEIADLFVESIEAGAGPRTTDADLKKAYGEDIIISRVGNFNLIHLDHPDAATIARRTREFDPSQQFPDDCPLCQQMREQGCDVVFDRED